MNPMNPRKLLTSLAMGMAAVALAAAVSAASPRQPLALPQVGATFVAPYDAVWDATLKGLGILKLPVADKASGRIETEPFSFAFPIGSGQGGSTQVMWFSLKITVRQAGDRTNLQVEPYVHDAFLQGFAPGPTNNPWADLFAKVATQLALRR